MGRKKNYQREAVLDQAMTCFLRKGFEATSLQDLGDATSLNRKSLYAEFGSKEALFLEAIQTYVQYMRRQAGYLLARKPLGPNNIYAFFEALVESPGPQGCLFTLTINERHIVSPEAYELVNRAYSSLEVAFAKNLVQHDKPFEPSKVALLTRYLIVAMQGLTTAVRMDFAQEQRRSVVDLLLLPLRLSTGCPGDQDLAGYLTDLIGKPLTGKGLDITSS